LGPWAGKRVTVGIRPEHLQVTAASRDAVRLTVAHVEHLGADTLVYGQGGGGGGTLTVRLPDIHPLEKGSALHVVVSPEKLHVFDPDSGKRIHA
jgi:sn-glycerol 3-phosphate transport system ATP-binding protein